MSAPAVRRKCPDGKWRLIPVDPMLALDRFPLEGVVIKPFGGRYCKFKIGEWVLVRRQDSTFTVRKAKLPKTPVPLITVCCGVPRGYVRIER